MINSNFTTIKNVFKLFLAVGIFLIAHCSKLYAYSYSSSTITQNTGTTLPGTVNQLIMTWKINTNTSCCNNWTLNSLTFTMQNTNNAQITSAKIYTNTSGTFSTSSLKGTITSFPSNVITFSGLNQPMGLIDGLTRYYYLVYDIAANAGCDGVSVFDAQATSLIWNTSTNVAINQNPAGAVTLSGPTSPPTITISPTTVNSCSGSNVVFTATAGNAGTPTYQWTLNSGNVGSNSTSYSTTALVTGSQVQCTVTSSNVCASPRSVASNIPSVTVTPTPTASVDPPTPQTVCGGGTIFLTAVTSASNPTYQWLQNGSPISGETNSTYTASTTGNYAVIVTENGSTTCSTTSAAVTETFDAPTTPAVTIAESINNICSGTNVTFTATPVNGGSAPSYQWYLNNNPVGTNSATYSNNSLANGNTVSCVMTSNKPCASPATAASNEITMTVTQTPTASFTPNAPQSVCNPPTASIALTAVTNATNPTYQWAMNGTNISGATNNIYNVTQTGSYAVIITENGSTTCSSTSPAVTETINATTTPSITISATSTNICSGTNVTFTATPVNGGSSPTYQWILNNTAVGTNSATYSNNNLANGDKVSCFMTSNKVCASPTTAQSTDITMQVTTVPTASFTPNTPQSVCNPPTPSITLTAVTSATNPTFQWKLNGGNISGATNNAYDVTQTGTYAVIITENGSTTCSTTSSSVAETITPEVNPTINISTANTTACAGASVVFNATVTGGGSTPNYQWRLNGNPTGTNSPSFTTSSLTNGDVISCRLISNATCANPATVFSNNLNMTVNAIPTASVSPGFTQSICSPAASTTLTAVSSATNNPTYQWKLDGTNISGATASTYNATVSGSYSVVVTDNGGTACSSPVSSAVLVNKVASPSASASVTPSTICRGSSANLTSSGSTGGTFNFPVNTSQTIPDPPFGGNSSGISQTVNVSGLPGDMSGVTISLTLTANSYVLSSLAELEFYLARPGGSITNTVSGSNILTTIPGQSIVISTDNGSGTNFTSAVFSDNAANSITAATGNITGNWRPEEAFSSLTGNPNGIWTLRALDDTYSFGATGTLTSWKLTFTLPNSVSYSWTSSPSGFTSPFQTPGNVTPNDTTDYTVTVTDNVFGCTTTATTHINVVPRPSPKIVPAPDTTICAGTDYYLHVIDTGAFANGYPAGTTIDWIGIVNGLQPTDSVLVSGNTTFQVRVRLPQGLCPTLSPVRTVITKTLSVNSAITKTSCELNNGKVSISATGGVAPYRFVWTYNNNIIKDITTSSNLDSIENLSTGNYCLQLTDNYGNASATDVSCTSAPLCFNVLANPALNIGFSNVVNVNCNGNGNGSATATASGEIGPYIYNWIASGNTAQTENNLSGGTYYITVSSANGCTKTDSVTINEPSALNLTFTADSVKCQGGDNGSASANVTGGTPGYSYEWYDAEYNTINQTTSTAINLSAGTYIVIIYDAHSCVIYDSVHVGEPATPIDDNNVCTTDACDPNTGIVTHDAVNVDDNDPCTLDGCDPVTGIYHNPATEICGNNIDDNCNGQVDENCAIDLSIKLMIEGFYAGNETLQPVYANAGVNNNPLICDAITVAIHNADAPFDIDTIVNTFINVNGVITITLPYNRLGMAYYIAIIHRNSVETWSKLPVTLGTNTSYDFSH